MDTPDVKGLEFSTLDCKDVNANLLSKFEEPNSSDDNPSVGSADPLTVYLRIRPFSAKEQRNNNISCVKVLNRKELITLPPVNSHTHMGIKKVRVIFYFLIILGKVQRTNLKKKYMVEIDGNPG